jgi:hypothetical protein
LRAPPGPLTRIADPGRLDGALPRGAHLRVEGSTRRPRPPRTNRRTTTSSKSLNRANGQIHRASSTPRLRMPSRCRAIGGLPHRPCVKAADAPGRAQPTGVTMPSWARYSPRVPHDPRATVPRQQALRERARTAMPACRRFDSSRRTTIRCSPGGPSTSDTPASRPGSTRCAASTGRGVGRPERRRPPAPSAGQGRRTFDPGSPSANSFR